MVRLLTPACTKVAQANRRTRATMRCALVGVAAERFRIQHGHWPASTEALVKDGFLAAVPLDPFDGKELRCKLVADGVLVYSVGLDGVDDGGVINRENPFTPGSDLGFRLWNVEVRRQAPLPPRDDDGGPR